MPSVMRRITSVSNPLLRNLLEGSHPDQGPRRRIVLEGPHLVEEGLRSSRVHISHLFVLEERARSGEFGALLSHPVLSRAEVILASAPVIRKLSATRTPQGVLTVGDFEAWTLSDILETTSGLVVVSDGIQDPGNLGGLIRTADAAGAGAVLLLPGSADPLGPKALRATAGSLFHLPVVRAGSSEDLRVLKGSGYCILGAEAHGGTPFFDTAFPEKTVLVFGSEGQGLSSGARAWCQGFFTIPVKGHAESLNVASAAAVCIYEYVRQLQAAKGASRG